MFSSLSSFGSILECQKTKKDPIQEKYLQVDDLEWISKFVGYISKWKWCTGVKLGCWDQLPNSDNGSSLGLTLTNKISMLLQAVNGNLRLPG